MTTLNIDANLVTSAIIDFAFVDVCMRWYEKRTRVLSVKIIKRVKETIEIRRDSLHGFPYNPQIKTPHRVKKTTN